MAMTDFVGFCTNENLIDIAADGTVYWKRAVAEAAVKSQKSGKYKQHFDGGRDQRKDLSDDYKDYCHHMGTVWPFKVVAKGGKKQAAPVGK